MAVRLVLLFSCLPGLAMADLRLAAYEYPEYYNHWPNAYGMSQFKSMGKGACAASSSERGVCVGQSFCGELGQPVSACKMMLNMGCRWQAVEAKHKVAQGIDTQEECQQRCGTDADCTAWRRSGNTCKLYTEGVKLSDYGSGASCYNKTGPGTMKHLHAKYMVASDFNYKGLQNQKQNNYDQFLRSNIDNEHDNRNFQTEDGEDALPFRTMRSEVYTSEKGATENYDLFATMKPGESMLVPLRWNNPHSAELEVNLWIFQGDQPVVVPVKRPTCSGEGYQDNIFKFTIPSDFHKLGSKIPGFSGCNADTKPPCTLQVYSHSVETRTYAIGFPIIVTGHDDSRTTSSTRHIEPKTNDPGMDVTNLRDLCLPSSDATSDIKKAVPRWARLVSDVYNHAYQNSDFSPYSGQQHESISKNLQAAAINKMVTGNRGELGKFLLSYPTAKKLRALRTLENRLYRNYEAIANKIIKELGSQMLDRQGITITAEGSQQVLGKCFRCGEVGSLMRERLTTNTYIPSFQLPQKLMVAATSMVPEKYKSLINENGIVQIYMAAYADLAPFFYASMSWGILYQGAALKPMLTTKADSTKFRRKGYTGATKDGRRVYDRGEYAAEMAMKERANELGCNLDKCSPEKPPKKQKKWCNGKLEKPLMKNREATCVTGECSACGAFFGKGLVIKIPAITPMAESIAKGNQVPPSKSNLKAYPDRDGSPRFGRPNSNITGETDEWELINKKKPNPTSAPTTAPPPTARRRRRRATSAGPARRRRRGTSGKSRRRSRPSRRRRAPRRRRAADLAELGEEFARLQRAE